MTLKSFPGTLPVCLEIRSLADRRALFSVLTHGPLRELFLESVCFPRGPGLSQPHPVWAVRVLSVSSQGSGQRQIVWATSLGFHLFVLQWGPGGQSINFKYLGSRSLVTDCIQNVAELCLTQTYPSQIHKVRPGFVLLVICPPCGLRPFHLTPTVLRCKGTRVPSIHTNSLAPLKTCSLA